MESEQPKTIQIPFWMSQAISELADRNNRSISCEIAYLVEEAIKRDPKMTEETGQLIYEAVEK